MLPTHAPAIFLVIVFILMRFRPSTLIRYVRIFILIYYQESFQIIAFSMIALSVLFNVERRPKCIEMWRGPKFQTPLFHFLRGKPCPCQHFTIAFVLNCLHCCHSFNPSLCHLSPFHFPFVAVSRPCHSPDFTLAGPTIGNKII